jgi:hypothetical protein
MFCGISTPGERKKRETGMIRIRYDYVTCCPLAEPELKISYEYIEHAYEKGLSDYYQKINNLLFGHIVRYHTRPNCNRGRLAYPRRKRAKKEE